MSTEILISSDPWENRVAILEDGALAEIYFEREEKVIGSIYKGKVQNVLPGMGASFVDIGLGRNAFLYVDDINKTPLNIGEVEITQGRSGWTINEKVSRGDDVLVQIVKEPRGLKGARISTNISLPGRYLILMPTGKYSGVSRKIDSADERNRLKSVMKRIRPEGMATVVRTAAAGVSDAELIADLGVLIRMWHGILEGYNRAPSPSLVHKDMNLVFKAARDFITPQVGRVLIDDAEESEKVRDFMRLLGPQYVERIQPYERGKALFKDFHIDSELEKLLRSKVNLPSGGSIVIETTEALTVIDVNSGKFTGGKNLEDTIVKTNVEAAAEIARQVRLRDIGGIIVCDFIDMNQESSRNRVLATLEEGLRRDRTRTTIQSFSALGLLEFTRKRVGKDLSGQLQSHCPTCAGNGHVLSPETVAIEAFREVRSTSAAARNGAAHSVEVLAAPTVAAQIEFWYEDERKALEAELGAPIVVHVDAEMHPEKKKIKVLQNGAADAALPPLSLRVGDEVEVDILNARLPNGTSGLAVIDGRLVEVENAANAAGQTIRIKIIDIDEDGILAETRTPVAQAGETKRRRRRGGRGRKRELTPAEQTEELRELAEEAARGLGGRPAIGISTSPEPENDVRKPALPADQRLITIDASKVPVGSTDGAEIVEDEVLTSGAPALAASAEEGEVRRRRRRRRRRGRGGESSAIPAQFGISAESAAVQSGAPVHAADDAEESEDSEEFEDDDVPAVAGAQPAARNLEAQPVGENGEPVRRRRRRRRRRGRGGAAAGGNGPFTPNGAINGQAAAAAGAPQITPPIQRAPVPDRHIFRAASDGSIEPTGITAPREPSRAIAPWNRRITAPAVEPPPPSLSIPVEKPRSAKPAVRRRSDAVVEIPAAQLRGGSQVALPSGEPAAQVEDAPKRRTRAAAKAQAPASDIAEASASAAPAKTTRRRAAATVEGAGEPVKRTRRAAAKTDDAGVPAEKPKRTARAKKETAAASPARKKTATRRS